MKRILAIAMLAVAAGASAQTGDNLQVFATRTDFDTEYPTDTQSCEDFEDNSFSDGAIFGFPAPLDANTDNAFFSPGSIIPALTLQDNPINDDGGGSADGLVAIGGGAAGNPSDLVAANTFVDTLDVLLSPEQRNVAFDVYAFNSGGTGTVTFFDSSDAEIGTVNVSAGTSSGGFVGVSSEVAIARINVEVDGEAEAVDDFCFAAAQEPEPEPTAPRAIPALGTLGLMLLSALMGLGSIVFARGRPR